MMGKAVFLLIASAMLGATALMFGGKQSAFDAQSEQSEYQANLLARDIATSGYNEILSAVKRQKMDAVGTKPDVSMLGGAYNQSVTEDIYGDLNIEVDGVYAGVEHTVKGNVIFAVPFPGAIALSDDEVEADGSGSSYSVSGLDGRAPSRGTGGGFLRPITGIVTDAIHTYDVNEGFDADRVLGAGNEEGTSGSPSVGDGFDQAFYETIYQEALVNPYTLITESFPSEMRQSIIQSTAEESDADDPKIIRVQGNLVIDYPVTGHGVLIVEDGDLHIFDDAFRWEGLVLVRKQSVDTVRVNLGLGSEVHGSLVGYSIDGGGEPGDCAGDFEIDGDQIITQEDVRLKFTVLGAAISAGGSYDMPVTAKIRINGQAYTPFGNWGKAVSGNVNTGNSGTTYVWEPEGIFPPDSRIRIGARSWIKKHWSYSGNKNKHWKIHMQEDNLTVDDQLSVLRDGDTVPNVGGYLGQYSVEDFISEYIDTEADEMTLDPSDAIYLYELGVSNPASSAHDMQDLVVLVSMTKAGAGTPPPGGGETTTCSGPGIFGTSRIEFNMSGASTVRYSAEALAKLGKTFDAIADQIRVVVTKDESFTGYEEGQYGSHSSDGEQGEQ